MKFLTVLHTNKVTNSTLNFYSLAPETFIHLNASIKKTVGQKKAKSLFVLPLLERRSLDIVNLRCVPLQVAALVGLEPAHAAREPLGHVAALDVISEAIQRRKGLPVSCER